MRRDALGGGLLGGARRKAVEITARDLAQRPADDPPPGPLACEPQPYAAHHAAAVGDREAERLPAARLIGHGDLVDRRPCQAGDDTTSWTGARCSRPRGVHN